MPCRDQTNTCGCSATWVHIERSSLTCRRARYRQLYNGCRFSLLFQAQSIFTRRHSEFFLAGKALTDDPFKNIRLQSCSQVRSFFPQRVRVMVFRARERTKELLEKAGLDRKSVV